MEDTPKPPTVFSNRVIRQLVDHSMGDDMEITDQDFLILRFVYRWCGGNWEQLYHGDPLQQELLKQIVNAWGQMPNRVRNNESAK